MHCSTDTPALSPAHSHMLAVESAISADVIAARGYRTITNPAELEALGFSPAQRRPGLLIPQHAPDGSNSLHVLRPDVPRVVENKRKRLPDGTHPCRTIKYQQPKGASLRLDIPPGCRAQLGNPQVPLWLVEGSKKADSLASRGLCAVCLSGVWGFKARNDFGGVALAADFDYIALDGRRVVICYDSDVVAKPQVKAAMSRLREHLQRKSARVGVAYLPPGPNGAKVGVDDYLASGHTVEDLKRLVEAPRPVPTAARPRVELLDAAPPTIRRPLALVDGIAYAATWLHARVTRTEGMNRQGEIVSYNPPEVKTEQRLFVLRDDGRIFGEGDESVTPLAELGIDVALPAVPPVDGTMSKKAVEACRAGARPDAANLIERVASVYDCFIDFDASLATWLTPAWTVMGYPWFHGEKGAGKTQAGTVWAMTARLGVVLVSSGSFAALRDLADIGASLLFDDAEVLTDTKKCDPAKRELALAGNRRGTRVPLKEQGPDRNWIIRWVDAFAPRAFTSISTPDNVLASRSIVIPLVRTSDEKRANRDPASVSRWPCDRQELIDDCWMLALSLLSEAADVWDELDDEVDILGRDFEPFRSVVATARLLDRHGADGLEDTVRLAMRRYQEEKADILGDDWTVEVVKALVAYAEGRLVPSDIMDISDMSDMTRQGWTLSASQVCELLKKAAEAEGEEVTWPESRRVGRILGRLRLKRRRAGDKKRSRGWYIGLKEPRRLALAYRVDTPLTKAPDISSDVSGATHRVMSDMSETSIMSDVLDPWDDGGPEPASTSGASMHKLPDTSDWETF